MSAFLVAIASLHLCNGASLTSSQMQKHALDNECTETGLQSGTYEVLLPNDDSFTVDCLADGTMYINPSDQGIYHYRRQAGLKMKFKLLQAHSYHDLSEIDREALLKPHIEQVFDAVSSEDETVIIVGDVDDENPDESDESDDPLQAIEDQITEKGKKTVNTTAQYIVYAVIIVMAIAFSVGICLLIYWWCCRQPQQLNTGDNATYASTLDKENLLDTIDEKAAFMDIRSPNTILRAKMKKELDARTIPIHVADNPDRMEANDIEDEHERLLQNPRSSVYDDIDGAGDNEDGDDMIAHYGATAAGNDGYVIRR